MGDSPVAAEALRLRIATLSDVRDAPDRIRARARKSGFDGGAAEEIALAGRELALNVHQHGGGGWLLVRDVHESDRSGVELEAVDGGAGMPDVEGAFRDGFSTRGSYGYGLGTVNRLMHCVEVQSPRPEGTGTRLVARRWRYSDSAGSGAFLEAGFASRPCPGEKKNGDAFLLASWDDKSLVAVIDGMGHGERAHRAARNAYTYVRGHAREPLGAIFRGTDRVCRGSRGVVMALVRFDWGSRTISVGNLGNVEVRVFDNAAPGSFVVRRGFLGRRAPEPPIRTVSWSDRATMILHTDGVGGNGLSERYRAIEDRPPQRIARQLLLHLARERDDATVAVLRRSDDRGG